MVVYDHDIEVNGHNIIVRKDDTGGAGDVIAEGDVIADGDVIANTIKRWKTLSTNPLSQINLADDGTITFETVENAGTDLLTRIRIQSDGNVGIGTYDPEAKLDIRKTIKHEFGADKPGLTVGSLHISHEPDASENESASITFGAAQKAESAQSGIYAQSSEIGTKMSFATTDNREVGAKTRMLIDETGNIFLGTSKTETTTPENWVYLPNKLLIGYNDDLSYNKFGLKLDDVSITVPTGEITSKALRLFHLGEKVGDNAEENNLLTVVKYNGNIGIGDMVPEEKLHVDGIVQANLGFKGDGSLITNLNGSNIITGEITETLIPDTISRSNHTHTTPDVNALSLKNGAEINEFSTDGTLSDNSDLAVPTEKAVRSYVDKIQSGVVQVKNLTAGEGLETFYRQINFPDRFSSIPTVVLGVKKLWVEEGFILNYSLYESNLSISSFQINFNTWGNTDANLKEITIQWMAYGPI